MPKIPRWEYKIVSGIIESGRYSGIIANCDTFSYKLYPTADGQSRFIKALQLNLINRKKYSALKLINIYDLNVSEKTFFKYKAVYVENIFRAIHIL